MDKNEDEPCHLLRKELEIVQLLQKKAKINQQESLKLFQELLSQSRESRKILIKEKTVDEDKKVNLVDIILANHKRLLALEILAKEKKEGKKEKKMILKKLETNDSKNELKKMSKLLAGRIQKKKREQKKVSDKLKYEISQFKDELNQSNARILMRSSLSSFGGSVRSSHSSFRKKKLPSRKGSFRVKSQKPPKSKRKKKKKIVVKSKEKQIPEKRGRLFIYTKLKENE